MLLRQDDWHAVWIGWLDNGEQWGWYVFAERWDGWRPVAATPLPELPPGWDVPCP